MGFQRHILLLFILSNNLSKFAYFQIQNMRQSQNSVSAQQSAIIYQKLSDRLLRLKKTSQQKIVPALQINRKPEYTRSSSLQTKHATQRKHFELENKRQETINKIVNQINGLSMFGSELSNIASLKRINPKQIKLNQDQRLGAIKNNMNKNSRYRDSLKVQNHPSNSKLSHENSNEFKHSQEILISEGRLSAKSQKSISQQSKGLFKTGFVPGRFYTAQQISVLVKYNY